MGTHIANRTFLAAGSVSALIVLLSAPVMAEQKDMEAIENKLQQYAVRFNKGDAEAVSRLYREDVVYYGPLGRVFKGREAVRQHYHDNLAAGFDDMTVEVIELRLVGDTAYDVARYTIGGPSGEPLTGYHLAILQKEDGEWLVQRTLVNVVMPMPPSK